MQNESEEHGKPLRGVEKGPCANSLMSACFCLLGLVQPKPPPCWMVGNRSHPAPFKIPFKHWAANTLLPPSRRHLFILHHEWCFLLCHDTPSLLFWSHGGRDQFYRVALGAPHPPLGVPVRIVQCLVFVLPVRSRQHLQCVLPLRQTTQVPNLPTYLPTDRPANQPTHLPTYLPN